MSRVSDREPSNRKVSNRSSCFMLSVDTHHLLFAEHEISVEDLV